jgi:hypothetical protein
MAPGVSIGLGISQGGRWIGPSTLTPTNYAATAFGRETGVGDFPVDWPPGSTTLTAGDAGHGSVSGNDNLTWVYCPVDWPIEAPVHYAEFKVSIASFQAATAPSWRIRAVKQTSPEQPGSGSIATHPSSTYGSPGWTTAYGRMIGEIGSTGYYRADVTDVINELAALPGGTGNAVVLVLEPQGPAATDTDTTFYSAQQVPTLKVFRSLASPDYQRKGIRQGRTAYYWPFDAGDMPAQGVAYSTQRAVIGGPLGYYDQTIDLLVSGSPAWSMVSEASSYAGRTVIAAPGAAYELTHPPARRLYGYDLVGDDADVSYAWPVNFQAKSYLLVNQTVQLAPGQVGFWWMDLLAEYGWHISFGDGGFEAQLSSGAPVILPPPAAYYDQVGAIKTHVWYWDRNTLLWHQGYHNGNPAVGWVWSNYLWSGAIASTAPGSGFGVANDQVRQGVFMTEFSTTRRLDEIKQACERARALWSAGVKAIPPILYVLDA